MSVVKTKSLLSSIFSKIIVYIFVKFLKTDYRNSQLTRVMSYYYYTTILVL